MGLDGLNQRLPPGDWENQDSCTSLFDFKGRISFTTLYLCYTNVNYFIEI